jgi:hypothetical protein
MPTLISIKINLAPHNRRLPSRGSSRCSVRNRASRRPGQSRNKPPASSSATTTDSNSPMSTSRMSGGGGRRQTCSAKVRREGLRRILRCPNCCAANARDSPVNQSQISLMHCCAARSAQYAERAAPGSDRSPRDARGLSLLPPDRTHARCGLLIPVVTHS